MQAVFDTSILIDGLRNLKPAIILIERAANKEIIGYISGITEGEVLSGRDCKKEIKLKETLELIALFTKVEVNNKILQKAAEFRRNYDIELPDAIIAATAFQQKCKLWTKNKKDFEKIKEIEVEEPY